MAEKAESPTHFNVTETELIGVITKVGYRIFYALLGLAVVGLGMAFGSGTWAQEIRSDLNVITSDVREIKKEVVPRIRNLEVNQAREILPEAKLRLDRLEATSAEEHTLMRERISALEALQSADRGTR